MPSETPEEQIARVLKTMGKDPEELAEHIESHLGKPSRQPARLRAIILQATGRPYNKADL